MKIVAEILLPARLEHLPSALELVTVAAGKQGIPQSKFPFLELAVEEAVVNICHYSYPREVGDFEIRCLDDAGRFVVEIADSGIPFDPTASPDPDINQDLATRQTGGLGIYFMKKFVNDVEYQRVGTRNILRFSVTRG